MRISGIASLRCVGRAAARDVFETCGDFLRARAVADSGGGLRHPAQGIRIKAAQGIRVILSRNFAMTTEEAVSAGGIDGRADRRLVLREDGDDCREPERAALPGGAPGRAERAVGA